MVAQQKAEQLDLVTYLDKTSTPLQLLRKFQRTLANRCLAAGKPEEAELHLVDQGYVKDSSTYTLRAKLIEEESKELNDEFLYDGTPESIIKEMADVLYVIYGACAVWGWDIEGAFRAVHQNNMEKVLNGTIREDGKLQKPADHPKPDMREFVSRASP